MAVRLFKSLNRRSCAQRLAKPALIVGKNWTLVDSPRVETFGITVPLNNLTTGFRTLQNGRVIPRIKKKRNDLFEFTHVVINRGLLDRKTNEAILENIHMARFINPEEIIKFIDAYRGILGPRSMVTLQKGIVLWHRHTFHLKIGNLIDKDLKDIFRGERPEVLLPGVRSLAGFFYNVLKLVPMGGGIRVALDRPTNRFPVGDPRYCCQTCATAYRGPVPVTEVDLVGYDPEQRQCVLVELKTFKSAEIDAKLLRKYQLQAWLTWMAFSKTYPTLMHHTRAVIVVVSLSHGSIRAYNVRPPAVSKKLISTFKVLGAMCPNHYKSLTPAVCKPVIKGAFITAMIQENGDLHVARSLDQPPTRVTPRLRIDSEDDSDDGE
jgi:hypothetical protein